MRVHVFNIKTGIVATSNNFTTSRTATGRGCKEFLFVCSLVNVYFSKNLVYPANTELKFFQQNVILFWKFFDLLVSVTINVIKINRFKKVSKMWRWLFLSIFYAYQRTLKHYGKAVEQVVIPGDFKSSSVRKAHTILAYYYWLTVLTCIIFNRPLNS